MDSSGSSARHYPAEGGTTNRAARLSRDYQRERQGFESGDLTALVVRALCACVGSDVSDVNDVSDIRSKDERRNSC